MGDRPRPGHCLRPRHRPRLRSRPCPGSASSSTSESLGRSSVSRTSGKTGFPNKCKQAKISVDKSH